MDESSGGTFAATLAARERRLAGRLEGFGDIVFGFAVSQCALQLPTVNGHVDLAHPVALLLYFATFALIASLWLMFHRLMSGTFVAAGIDLIGAFSYLAFVSLIPYAMFALTHESASKAAARAAFLEYAALYFAATSVATVLTYRNLQRGWDYLSARERDQLWRAFLRRVSVAVMMALACAIDLGYGPAIGGLSLLCIAVLMRVLRWRFPHAPLAARGQSRPARVVE